MYSKVPLQYYSSALALLTFVGPSYTVNALFGTVSYSGTLAGRIGRAGDRLRALRTVEWRSPHCRGVG